MSRGVRIVLIVLLLLSLVGLRAYADTLFYDPLSDFFKGEYQGEQLPQMALGKLLTHTALRFCLTALISVLIIYFWFKGRSKTQLTLVIMGIVFVLFFSTFWVMLTLKHPPLEGLFYIRRFLIQPLVLILLVPAFYYEIRTSKRRA